MNCYQIKTPKSSKTLRSHMFSISFPEVTKVQNFNHSHYFHYGFIAFVIVLSNILLNLVNFLLYTLITYCSNFLDLLLRFYWVDVTIYMFKSLHIFTALTVFYCLNIFHFIIFQLVDICIVSTFLWIQVIFIFPQFSSTCLLVHMDNNVSRDVCIYRIYIHVYVECYVYSRTDVSYRSACSSLPSY